jgi:Family of unknown function (DUF6312)
MRVRMVSGVRRVTMLAPERRTRIVADVGDGGVGRRVRFTVIKPNGQIERGALRVDLGPVKKERRLLRPFERRLRRMVRAERRALDRYLVLHDRSRRRRRSGWARDLPSNMFKVIRRST